MPAALFLRSTKEFYEAIYMDGQRARNDQRSVRWLVYIACRDEGFDGERDAQGSGDARRRGIRYPAASLAKVSKGSRQQLNSAQDAQQLPAMAAK